jgi:hypothetical protein
MKFCIKIHKIKDLKILAICDEEVLEKEFEFNGLKFKISKNFYFEKYADEKEIEEILKNVNLINAFGNNSVNFLISKKLINEKKVLNIGNQKHAIVQIL